MAPARDAILQAVQRGNEAAARAYLADGGDPSAAFTQGPVAGLTLLMAASNFGQPGMVDLLLLEPSLLLTGFWSRAAAKEIFATLSGQALLLCRWYWRSRLDCFWCQSQWSGWFELVGSDFAASKSGNDVGDGIGHLHHQGRDAVLPRGNLSQWTVATADRWHA